MHACLPEELAVLVTAVNAWPLGFTTEAPRLPASARSAESGRPLACEIRNIRGTPRRPDRVIPWIAGQHTSGRKSSLPLLIRSFWIRERLDGVPAVCPPVRETRRNSGESRGTRSVA